MRTWGDLLEYYPFRYIDKTKIHTISEISPDKQYIQLKGVITSVQTAGSSYQKRLVARLRDTTGVIDLVWFQGISYIEKVIKVGTEYIVFGKPNYFKGVANISHPELEPAIGNEIQLASKFEPVYSSSEKLKVRGLDSKGINALMKQIMGDIHTSDLPEYIPYEVMRAYTLLDRYHTIRYIHQPENELQIQQAQYRIKFEEFFVIQTRLLRLKVGNKKYKGYLFEKLGTMFNKFYNEAMPFELTNAQKNVLKEIRRDTLIGIQMNRLLQGDVGSGKTIVALITMLIAIDNGFQACIMAPTEILAQQHYKTITALTEKLSLNVSILTGSVKGKARQQCLQQLADGGIDILIGTHALIEPKVIFKNLGMVVIDEQHRFGVEQRAKLWAKNELPPHILVMTATPIPRTLAMTLYGDLDISILDELPPGRKSIKTIHQYDSDRLKVFHFMKQEIAKGRQIYVVYPLIEESEKLDYKHLMDGYEAITNSFPRPEYEVSVMHGRLASADKEFEMQRFAKGQSNIMVATTVIEVGVNVPNASVMVIESAERFGLSQLHQLRGRVGRGAEQSYCILMSDVKLSNDARKRLQTMVETNDGFVIAEVDMELRGPGDIEGTRQSGLLDMKMADISKDKNILFQARQAAQMILEKDEELSSDENKPLANRLNYLKNRAQSDYSKIS